MNYTPREGGDLVDAFQNFLKLSSAVYAYSITWNLPRTPKVY